MKIVTPPWLTDIENRSGNLPVLLVEGSDDRDWFEYFFDQHNPNWRQKFIIFPVGGKQHVINGISIYHSDKWSGIIDQDEGIPIGYEDKVTNCPRIKILPRYCLESYLIIPEELWQFIPDSNKPKSYDDWQDSITSKVPDWVCHGAMWRVLRKIYQDNHLPEGLVDEPVTDRNEIKKILTGWHDSFNPDLIMAEYENQLSIGQHLSSDEQIKKYIHGKIFYTKVIKDPLGRLFPGKNNGSILEGFRNKKSHFQPPDDLKPLLNQIIESFS